MGRSGFRQKDITPPHTSIFCKQRKKINKEKHVSPSHMEQVENTHIIYKDKAQQHNENKC